MRGSSLPAAAAAASCPPTPVPGADGRLRAAPWKRVPAADVAGQGGPLTKHPFEDDWERRGVRAALTGPPSKDPITVEFADKEAKYTVAIHHAPQYHILRHWFCGDDLNFARSIYRCRRINPQGGKSRAAFFVSHDRRFLLKAVNRFEFNMLTTQHEALMWYVDKVLFDKLPSVLAQVVGLFTVTVSSKKSKGPVKHRIIVQRNLRFNLLNTRYCVFDLKGIGKSRRVPSVAGVPGQGLASLANTKDDSDEEDGEGHTPPGGTAAGAPRADEAQGNKRMVLWDQNFREWTEGKPLCLVARDLKYLEAAVWNDTLMLSRQELMDYSLLLVAVLPEDYDPNDCTSPQAGSLGTLSLGIIDYLRPYTWDKKAEKNFKQLVRDASNEPTVIEPSKYADRFRSAMGTFFVAETPTLA